MTFSFAAVHTIRDGRVVAVREYATKGEAVKASGLSASAMTQQNVEIVRVWFEACNAGHEPDLSGRGNWKRWGYRSRR